MNKEIKAVKELFTQANNSNLIKGFLLGGDTVRFQTNDGTMMLLKVVPLEQNMDSETISTIEEDKGHEKYIVLEDTNFDCLMITVVSYKDLWEDVLAKGLITLDENDEVIDNKTHELRKYLEEKGVKFSNKVDTKSDDMSYDYFAEFEDSQATNTKGGIVMDNYTFYVYADDVKDGITLDTAIELYKNTNVCTSYKALGVTKNRHYSCDLVNNLGQNNTDKISNDYTVMAEFKDDNIIKVNVLNRLKDEFLK